MVEEIGSVFDESKSVINQETLLEWAKRYFGEEDSTHRLHWNPESFYATLVTPERSDNLMPPSHTALTVLKETGEIFDLPGTMHNHILLRQSHSADEFKDKGGASGHQPVAIVRMMQ